LIRHASRHIPPAVPQLNVEQAIEEAESGRLRPVYLVLGEELFFRQQVLGAMRKAVVGDAGASLNEDQFVAGEVDVKAVLGAARTLPMFGTRRLVTVRSVERWDKGDVEEKEAKGVVQKPLDQLADYAGAAPDTTTLLLIADKLDNRRRLVALAKRDGFLVVCSSLPAHALPNWVRQRARERGHSLAANAAELLAELCGADLSVLADAIERVELFVGAGNDLTEAAVLECVANMQPGSVWDLVNAVGRRDAGAALAALDRVFEPGAGPRLVGLLCWSVRQLIRFGSGRRAGLTPEEAARQAGAPPFKARELNDQLRQLSLDRAERWLETLAQLDFDLKGGSRMPQKALLETALLGFCR
jgi:DNA polymerase III subunit delta